MNIRKLYYLHHRLAAVKAWYFLIPAVIFGVLAVTSLQGNYRTMTTLREAVYKADRENGDVEKALSDLRRHVYSHMNTNLVSGSNPIKPPIQLKARYDRLVETEKERVKALNAQITARGEQICGALHPAAGYNAPRVACLQEYVRTNSIGEMPVPDQLYKFDFISPKWSPDLAGFSLLLAFLFLALFIARLLLERYMKKRLQ